MSSSKKAEDPVTFFSSAEGAPLRLDCNMWPQNFGTGQLGGDGCYLYMYIYIYIVVSVQYSSAWGICLPCKFLWW